MLSNLSERKKEILRLLADDGTVSVSDISRLLEVSAVTVRNDLASLEDEGFLLRTHGGASPAFHPSILARQRDRLEAKTMIAKSAASLVRDGDTVMVEAGTTTALIMRYLLGRRDIHVVTNSTLVIPYARVNPGIHLTVVGGVFRATTESLVGPVALRELEEFHVRLAFVGTDGFSIRHGLTTHLSEGAEIVRKMSIQAEETVLVADSSKYGRVGFAKVLPVTAISTIITDNGLSDEALSSLTELGITITRV